MFFEARFPQHSNPVSDPKPSDYFEAAGWYRDWQYYNPELSRKFYRTYRMLKWARETAVNRIGRSARYER
jgi:hypothetical protein